MTATLTGEDHFHGYETSKNLMTLHYGLRYSSKIATQLNNKISAEPTITHITLAERYHYQSALKLKLTLVGTKTTQGLSFTDPHLPKGLFTNKRGSIIIILLKSQIGTVQT